MTTDAAHESTEGRLRSAGLKVTAPRLAVLDAFPADPIHLSADEVYARVAPALPSTSLQAVYGVLAALVASGLLRKIEPAGSAARYEKRIGDNHHHLICRGCNAIEDVDCVIGEAPCLTPSDTHGFRLQAADVTFWGLCPSCQAALAE
ncbi:MULTISPECIES: Fur family transcriptional regulator [Microterricola]|uniref:Fur family transcriptional regulator, ferric uptake regulator n=2 Tax=Microterricola TaxID=518733 RepID=A0A1H1NQL3_9MICO|nr:MULTISPECIES: Fur family transcriptional regulator [Microterricola]PPL14493.1 transcriptional repressor [Microterricola pindariensis]SDS01262.1 Fur family transcriptional regulator, ferric uptake regulator [Microterricola viridarii]